MDDKQIIALMGKQVDVTWEDETGPQEAAGIFVGVTDDGWVCLDWGYAIDRNAKGFTIDAAK